MSAETQKHCALFCAYPQSETIVDGSKVARARIACTGADNQRYSKPSHSVIIAILGTHHPLVVGSNPTGPTICFTVRSEDILYRTFRRHTLHFWTKRVV